MTIWDSALCDKYIPGVILVENIFLTNPFTSAKANRHVFGTKIDQSCNSPHPRNLKVDLFVGCRWRISSPR
jgi:hypothetical protein